MQCMERIILEAACVSIVLVMTAVSAVVILSWIHAVFCCHPSKDLEGLLHICQPHAKEKGIEQYQYIQ